MKFYTLTTFPEIIDFYMSESIMGRAVKKGLIESVSINIRDYSLDKHHSTDDYPYGGGAGMIMQVQPVYDAWKAAYEKASGDSEGKPVRTVYFTAQGRTFNESIAKEYSTEESIILLCGHYEGIDERVIEEIAPDEISMGDFILTGGELPALTFMDAVSRLIPSVLHNDDSASDESFENDLLEYPQYSRPEIWHERKVPEILLSGDHAKVDAWRRDQAIERTKKRRPDLYEKFIRNSNNT
jgi:tRNA (guanine37-N1)-methyltransferase